MARKVILHIGGEKTGTTTLQKFLSYNSTELARRGFFYLDNPERPYFVRFGHFPIAACLLPGEVDFIEENKRDTLHEVLSSLADDIAAVQGTVVLSCEHLSSRLRYPEQLEKLRYSLGGADIEVVCYVREITDLALSHWSTAIKNGYQRPFSTSEIRPENPYFNYFHVLELWSSVFHNVRAREYKRERLVNCDICDDFCQFVGINRNGLSAVERENEALDAGKLEALRFINMALVAHSAPASKDPTLPENEFDAAAELRKEFSNDPHAFSICGGIRDILIAHMPPTQNALKLLMSNEERNTLRKQFESVNRDLSRNYIFGGLSDEWFSLSQDNYSQGQFSTNSSEQLSMLLRATVIRLAKTHVQAKSDLQSCKAQLLECEKRLKFAELVNAEVSQRCEQLIRFRGQSLTGDSDLDSRLTFGGSLGRADWRYRRGMGSDRAAVAA